MKRRVLAATLLALIIVAAAGGFLYFELRPAPSPYDPAFSDVQLRPITLSSSDCSNQGCATNIPVEIPFPANRGSTSAPYYANLILISNPGNSTLEVSSITASDVSGSVAGVSTVEVYYFASHSDFNTDGTPAGTPPGFCETSGILGCTVFSGSHGIPPKGGNYLEVFALEEPGSSQGSVSLELTVQWV